MVERFNQTPEYAAAFEQLRQNFTTTFLIDGPNMTLPEMAEMLCEVRDKAAEADALRAALATAQQEKAEALALLGKMREARDFVLQAIGDMEERGVDPGYGIDRAWVRAALSTPAPAALEAMRNRVLEEAAERCKIGPSDEWSKDCRDGYALAALEIENAIRAMKREGEG